MRTLGASDISTVPINEELIRQKYSKETKQIQVLRRTDVSVFFVVVSVSNSLFRCSYEPFQCFDAVVWVTGGASGL